MTKEYKALFVPSEDTEGIIGMCLELGIITQGNDISHTARMLEEAVSICLEEDALTNTDPSTRTPCEKEYFDKWNNESSSINSITFNGITLNWKMANINLELDVTDDDKAPQTFAEACGGDPTGWLLDGQPVDVNGVPLIETDSKGK